jgi:hypothetical protein
MAAFLLSRGWRRYLGSWWYRPLPGLDRLTPGQELFGTARAFALEKLRVAGSP